QTIKSLSLPAAGNEKLTARLLALAEDGKRTGEVRLLALAAVPGTPPVRGDLFDFVRGRVDTNQPLVQRSLAVEVLVRANRTREQLRDLTRELKKVGPMELDRLLEAYTKTTDDGVGAKLLTALRESPVRTSLRVAVVKARLAKYSPKVQKMAELLYAELDAD